MSPAIPAQLRRSRRRLAGTLKRHVGPPITCSTARRTGIRRDTESLDTMVVLIGYGVALGCIFGAYIIHGGNIGVILHALPTELMAILGGSLGAFAVNNQPKVLKATLAALPGVLKGSKYSKARYMELMALLYDILQKARKEGLMAIEKDVEDPAGSPLFQKYTVVGSDHHVVEFITDYLRMMVSGNLNAHEIESLMDSEIETHHNEAHGPVNALAPPRRRAAGVRHRRRGARRRQHDGLGRPAAGDPRRHDRLGAGRHLPRHPARLRRRRAARRPDRAEGRRRLEGAAVHQDDAARAHAGLRAAGRGRVRAQGAVLDGPADVLASSKAHVKGKKA